MFFVGSAPLAGDGHVNVSPKGPIGSLAVLDDHTVAYLDVVGSGAETIAHIRENGRVVVMLCAFAGPAADPAPARHRRVRARGDERFGALFEQAGFEPFDGARVAPRDHPRATSTASRTPAATACR